jgi:hypothetical protein
MIAFDMVPSVDMYVYSRTMHLSQSPEFYRLYRLRMDRLRVFKK